MSEEIAPARVGIDTHASAFSVWLDAFRWAAALEVLLAHVNHRVFLRFNEVPHGSKPPLFYLLNAVAGFSGPAVIVFFVLSGFLVGGTSLRRYRLSARFDMADYFTARLTRLWIVLIPVLLLTYGLNSVAVAFGARIGEIYGPDFVTSGAMPPFRPGIFLCNAAFLQTALCGQYGGNGALWSLFNEFWYYIFWPPLMVAIWGAGTPLRRAGLIAVVILGLGLLSGLQFIGSPIGIYFLLWLMGVVAADREAPFLRVHPVLAAAMLIAVLMVWRVTSSGEVAGAAPLEQIPWDFAIAALFANLVMNLKAAQRLRPPPLRGIHAGLAGFSFTLYCAHTPLINCMAAIASRAAGIGWHMAPGDWIAYPVYAGFAVAAVLFAYGLASLTERHTPALRRWTRARVPAPGKRRPARS